MPFISPKLVALSAVLAGAAGAMAHAQAPDTFGPGKVWCASQATCHLHMTDGEDYGFNGSAMPSPIQQALLGPCQSRKDCVAEISGVQLPHLQLLGNPEIARWVNAPPELSLSMNRAAPPAATRVSAAAASAGTRSDRRR